MKPIPGLDELLKSAKLASMYGTKMCSVIKTANADGNQSDCGVAVCNRKADHRSWLGSNSRTRRYVPSSLLFQQPACTVVYASVLASSSSYAISCILQSISTVLLRQNVKAYRRHASSNTWTNLNRAKRHAEAPILTKTNQYKECINHPKVVHVVALSGAYSRDEANMG